MSIITPIRLIAKKILYLVVKSESIPTDAQSLDINPDQPVIYVLDTRAWSNLLVLETECERLGLPLPTAKIQSEYLDRLHSVYTVSPAQPFKAWLNKEPKRSKMLKRCVEVLSQQPDLVIQFVPVSIFWGRPVAKQKHWLNALFSDSWGIAGRTRKLLTILFNGRNTLVNFSKIIHYRHNPGCNDSYDVIVDSLQDQLSNRLIELKTSTLGPDVSHRRTLVRELLAEPDLQKAIKKRSQENSISHYRAALHARRYLYEIVADCTNISIQLLQRGLASFWNKFYSGIEVTNNSYLNELALTHEIIYTPCHRSHIDYLLLSYVIHQQGLAIPYVAAGKNLNMPIIGRILRGAGAFFIRRSFKNNQLYSAVMFEYIAKLVSMGIPIEYFIEGGRSRTGRLLKPKLGMLSMTIRGYLKRRSRPLAFIPVYIGYEKLLETKAYHAELLGEDKKSEALLSSLSSITRIRGNFGRVYANFGRPVFLDEVLSQNNPDWRNEPYEQKPRPRWLNESVDTVSHLIMSNINRAAYVNPVNLIATALLATSKQHMDESELVVTIDMYRSIMRSLNYSEELLITEQSAAEQILHAESLGLINRRTHELGDIIYLDTKHSLSLTYHRNNILHLMALPSLIACCFFNMRTHTREEIVNIIELAYPFIKSEFYLVWEDLELPGVINNMLIVMSEKNLLIRNEQLDVYTRPGSSAQEFAQLNRLARVLSPVLEVYYLTLAILSRHESQKISKHKLEERCYLMAQRISMIYELNSPDFSDKKLISNFVDTLITIDYLREHDAEHVEYSEAFMKADRRARLLLSKEMRANILQMLKSSST